MSTPPDGIPFQNIPQRTGSEDEMLRRFADNIAANLRVALPAKVVSFDAETQTVTAQPLIREKINLGGNLTWKTIPVLLDVPVQFPQGGGFVLTFPITEGDEVLVVFNDMCIDSWWALGDIQNWNDRRRHDLSDAVALPGINSVPNVIEDISSTATELRTKNGDYKVRVKADEIRLVAPGAYVKLTPDNVKISADIKIELTAPDIEFNGDVNGGGSYLSHRHTGVEPGVGESGGVDH